jgi:Uma2 family endonuclease
MVATKLMTAEALERLPDDGYKYELERGEVVRMPPPGFEHLEIIGLLITYLNNFVLPSGLGVVGGEGGFVLERNPDTVRAPDVVFIRADRVPSGEARRHYVEQGPDLAIEVRSPSDNLRKLVAKADEYLSAGTRLVWIFDPSSRTVIVKTPDGKERTLGVGDTLDGGDVLPGFELPLSAIFRGE